MKKTLLQGLVVLALAAGAVLILITTGLFPAAEPAPIEAVPFALPKPLAAASVTATQAKAEAPRAHAFALCAAPAEGPRFHLAAAKAGTQSLFVWCRGGYRLFTVDGASTAPLVTPLAQLPTNMPRPSGAALGDVSSDGVADLIVGVSPQEGVVHAPGSGVFLAKGRAQGGFEAAIPLLEMPIVALTLAPMHANSSVNDIFVLTRGDAAARRQGQLMWFEAGGTPLKKASFEAGLLPRDLRTSQLTDVAALEVLVLAAEPGRVTAFDPLKPPAEAARQVALADGAALCAANDPRFTLARTTHDLLRVHGAPLNLTPWFANANVGPCAMGDLDRDGTPDALAVTDAGVIWLRDASDQGARELTLPSGYRALDIAYARSEGAAVFALALDVVREQLILLVWSPLPWPESGTLALDMEPLREVPALAEIPLE